MKTPRTIVLVVAFASSAMAAAARQAVRCEPAAADLASIDKGDLAVKR